ncbi:hypothetical protein BH09BAC5_BH09BAC5_24970 [soil metagenome]
MTFPQRLKVCFSINQSYILSEKLFNILFPNVKKLLLLILYIHFMRFHFTFSSVLLSAGLIFLNIITLDAQNTAIGAFGTVMKPYFYHLNYANNPHEGHKSNFTESGGAEIAWLKEGNRNEENQRFNSLNFNFYSSSVDSIQSLTFDSGSAPVDTFNGTQKSNNFFITLSHTNFLKTKWNQFSYYLIGIQIGGIINKSTYKLPGFDPHTNNPDPRFYESNLGAFAGLHIGFAYEFEKFFIYSKVSANTSFFAHPEYMIGSWAALQVGIIIHLKSSHNFIDPNDK